MNKPMCWQQRRKHLTNLVYLPKSQTNCLKPWNYERTLTSFNANWQGPFKVIKFFKDCSSQEGTEKLAPSQKDFPIDCYLVLTVFVKNLFPLLPVNNHWVCCVKGELILCFCLWLAVPTPPKKKKKMVQS